MKKKYLILAGISSLIILGGALVIVKNIEERRSTEEIVNVDTKNENENEEEAVSIVEAPRSTEAYAIEGKSIVENVAGKRVIVVNDLYDLKGWPNDLPRNEDAYSYAPHLIAYAQNNRRIAFSPMPYEGSGMNEVYILDLDSIMDGVKLVPDFYVSTQDSVSPDKAVLVGMSGDQKETVKLLDLAQGTEPRVAYSAPEGKTVMTVSTYGDDYLQVRWDTGKPAIEVFVKKDWEKFNPNEQNTYPTPELITLGM